MRSIVARMFDGCGSSRNFASQLVDPDCAAGAPTRAVTMTMAISAPERRLMAAPMQSILVNEGVEFHELIERRANAVAGGVHCRAGHIALNPDGRSRMIPAKDTSRALGSPSTCQRLGLCDSPLSS